MSTFVRPFMFVLIAMSFVLAACGGAATSAPTQAPEPTDVFPTTAPESTVAATEMPVEDPMVMYAPDAVTGDIITAGSSTVFPFLSVWLSSSNRKAIPAT